MNEAESQVVDVIGLGKLEIGTILPGHEIRLHGDAGEVDPLVRGHFPAGEGAGLHNVPIDPNHLERQPTVVQQHPCPGL